MVPPSTENDNNSEEAEYERQMRHRNSHRRYDDQFAREDAYTHGDLAIVVFSSVHVAEIIGFVGFVVNADRCRSGRGRLGIREQVDVDPSENWHNASVLNFVIVHAEKHTFVFGPWVIVGPDY